MLASEVITELSQVDSLESQWDGLATANQLPLMSPACVMAWWRHLASPDAEPRMVVVRDGERLVGFVPFYYDRRSGGLRLPGIELGGRLAPLVAHGREKEVTEILAKTLANSGALPSSAIFEGMPLAIDWTEALRDQWPGRLRPMSRRYQMLGCPTVSMTHDSFDAWLATKSSNFRREMRRLRRQFAADGGTTRLSTVDTLRADVDAFMRLHSSRWEGRGSSNFVRLGTRLPSVFNDVGEALLKHDGRFHLRMLEVGGEPISAQLFLAAGGRLLYVNGGWDERFAKLKPSMLGILATIEDALERGGEDLIDLGLGEQHYKLRFADGNDPVAWTILISKDIHLPRNMLQTVPLRTRARLRSLATSRLSDEQMRRLLRVRERLQRFG